ncbi:hypothetical protein PHO31112_04175 [Pandoraea horticolens]|uniref:Uncharacterized protein n=1 Tax=Pandoraea horticolens TaxID=2508298 RepID=A0A5E4XZ09_9BURK|nr:hypothetical protein [Pandoraea horticolens]VVE41517.1 hypothetical protein PHO31112_04175 [Pandoraea horticolens]
MRIGANACANAPVFRHLAPNVHVAGIDRHMVVLRLSRDRYFNLSYNHSQALRRLIGWSHDPAMSVDTAQAMQSMFDADGILAPGERNAPDSCTAIRDMPAQPGFHAWLAMPGDIGVAPRKRDVLRACYWLWQAQRATRRARIAGVIDRVPAVVCRARHVVRL